MVIQSAPIKELTKYFSMIYILFRLQDNINGQSSCIMCKYNIAIHDLASHHCGLSAQLEGRWALNI